MKTIKEILNGEDYNEFMIDCSLNFQKFFERVLGYEWNENFHSPIYSLFNKYKKICVQAPRQHGKTTLVSGFFIWRVLFNRDLKILIVSDSHKQAKEILFNIKDSLDSNELLKQLIPKDRDLSWSKEEIITTTKCRIVTKANNPKIKGGSYDEVFCDEVGEYKDKYNFYGVIQPTIGATDGRIIAIGTPRTKIDLLAELFAAGSGYKTLLLRAYMNGEPLWPSKYPKEKLEDIKSSTPVLEWETEYMCNPISSETSIFPFDLLVKGFDKYKGFEGQPRPELRYFMGCDFAMSQAAKADYTVFIVIGVDHEGRARIIKGERVQGESFENQYERFSRLYRTYNVNKATIDDGSFGKAFAERFINEGFVINPFKFSGGYGEQRMDLLTALRNKFENTRVIIPRRKDDYACIEFTDVLIQELMDFGVTFTDRSKKVKWESAGRHDDTVMALALAVESCRENYGNISLSFI
jgi:hypothetical protein